MARHFRHAKHILDEARIEVTRENTKEIVTLALPYCR